MSRSSAKAGRAPASAPARAPPAPAPEAPPPAAGAGGGAVIGAAAGGRAAERGSGVAPLDAAAGGVWMAIVVAPTLPRSSAARSPQPASSFHQACSPSSCSRSSSRA
eukprot:10721568-Lingulodinium_polyedra.AAC.1